MPRPPRVVSPGVKRLLCTLALALSVPLAAAEVDPKLDQAVREALPVCSDIQVAYEALPLSLPSGFKGTMVRVDGKSPSCKGQFAAVVSNGGGFFLGSPWPIAKEEGKTIEEKLKAFAWRALNQNVTPVVDRKHTADGLFKVTLEQLTEAGKLPFEGSVDPAGTVFFFGQFRRLGSPVGAQRVKVLDTFLANAPAKGATAPKVTIIEFSDFECPSCKRSSGYVDSILEKHGDKVRYVRFDVPLTGHPWAFPAALAGRAVYRQKPDLFWQYKKAVYESQGELNAFMFWDWARSWAEDHGLDLKAYDADLADAALKGEILSGAGIALSNDIRATPTYMVNGTILEAGEKGAALASYVETLLQ